MSDDILKLDNSNKLLEHGDTFYKKGEFTSAILCYEKLINNNNNDGKLWIKLGNSFLALKNYKNALFCYKKALYYNDDNKLRLKLIKKIKKAMDKSIEIEKLKLLEPGNIIKIEDTDDYNGLQFEQLLRIS